MTKVVRIAVIKLRNLIDRNWPVEENFQTAASDSKSLSQRKKY